MPDILVLMLAILIVASIVTPLFSATQLVAAWAAATRAPVLLRAFVPAAMLTVMFAIFGLRVTFIVALAMAKIAVIVGLARRAAENRLRFSLRSIMLGVTACAALLGVCVQPFIRTFITENLPSAEAWASVSIFSAATVLSIWAARSRLRKQQRATVLVLALLSLVLLLPVEEEPALIGGHINTLLAAGLVVHVYFAITVTAIWVQLQADKSCWRT